MWELVKYAKDINDSHANKISPTASSSQINLERLVELHRTQIRVEIDDLGESWPVKFVALVHLFWQGRSLMLENIWNLHDMIKFIKDPLYSWLPSGKIAATRDHS